MGGGYVIILRGGVAVAEVTTGEVVPLLLLTPKLPPIPV